jgi:protein-tyrosine-phosphatase
MVKATPAPDAILFVCYLNSIRSPIAEGLMKKRFGDTTYVQSCGLAAGELDDLMVSVMKEKGVDMSAHKARTMGELGDTSFDIVITFTKEAGEAAKAYFEDTDTLIEVWPTPDPTAGSLDVRSMMNNYRSVRDYIDGRLERRFVTKSG